MTTTEKPFGILGIGVAACVACCAGPIVGSVVATGLVTATGVAVFGTAGLLLAIPGIALVVRRRQRPSTCAPVDEPVLVAAPAHRPRRRGAGRSTAR